MLPRVLRYGILALGALVLTGAFLPGAAAGREGFHAGPRGYAFGLHRPAYGAIAVGLGVGLGYAYYGHPLDDSYDPPYGYGEYAEYGPWAYRGYGSGGCALTQRRMRTAYGLRWRTLRLCN